MTDRGYITKDLPFLDEHCHSVIEEILKVTHNYWDFSQALSKKAIEKDCYSNLVILAIHHARRLHDKESVIRIVDAHPEMSVLFPYEHPDGSYSEADKELIEKSIASNQSLSIIFHLLMRLYRSTAIGSPEEEYAKVKIEDFLSENRQMRLHGAEYLGHTGWRFKTLGQPEVAFNHILEALELAKESGDKWYQAILLIMLAEVSGQWRRTKNSYADTRKHLEKAVDLCKEINDRAGISEALQTMSVFASGRWELGEALDCQLEAVLIQGEIGDIFPGAAYNLGAYYTSIGDEKSAEEWYKLVEEHEISMGPYSWFHKVGMHLDRGNIKAAEKALAKATELTMLSGIETALGQLYLTTAGFEQRRGDLDSAIEYAQRALDINERASRQVRVRRCLLTLAEIELEQFMPTKQNHMEESSGPWMKRLEQELEVNEIPGLEARLMLMKSELRIRQGRYEEAEQLLDEVIDFTDGSAMRFVHKEALEKKESLVEEGVLPVDAPIHLRE
ncbi:MAG: tetratricopeptide repeat protein [Candidatus Thorarchaeota archaeon]